MSPTLRAARHLLPALVLLTIASLAFVFFGNGTQGYISDPSSAYWWTYQWVNEGSESEHGLLLFPLAMVLWWRNLRLHRPPESFRPPNDVIGLMVAGLVVLCVGGWAFEKVIPAFVHGSNVLFALTFAWMAVRVRELEIAEGDVPEARVGTGGGLLALALLVNLVGFGAQQTRISLLGILLAAVALAWFAGGRRWGRAALAPAFLMLFTLPLGTLMDYIGLPLRVNVTRVAELFANGVGIDVIRNGSQLVSADGRFQYDVAPACSGIRSLLALSALSFIVGYFSFRSWWRRGLLLALSLPFAFAGNVVRICTIILAGHWFGQDAGATVHDNSGFVIFLAVVGLALGTVTLLQRFLPERTAEQAVEPGSAEPKARPAWATAGLLAGLAVLLAGVAWKFDGSKADGLCGVLLAPNAVDPVPLPRSLDLDWLGYDLEVSRVEREVLPPDTGFSRRYYQNFLGKGVTVSIVLSGGDRSSIHQAEICLEGQGWSIKHRRIHRFSVPSIEGGQIPAQFLSIENTQKLPDGSTRQVPAVFAYWFVGGDRIVATNGERIVRDFLDRLFRLKGHRWAYVFVQTDAIDGEEAATKRLEEVINLAVPRFQTVGREEMAAAAAP